MRLGMVVAIGALFLIVLPGVVAAHAEVKVATPADGATVSEPVAEVSATYTEDLASDGSSLRVTDATGATVARGGVDPTDDRRMVATPAAPLSSGTYTVASTAKAPDGHIERTKWTFTVDIAPTPAPTPAAPSNAPTDSPSIAPSIAPTPAPSATASISPGPSADDAPSASGSDVLLPIIVALAIVALAGALLLGRRGRTGPPA
jgi:methionine-rich copper-binding protein CopC